MHYKDYLNKAGFSLTTEYGKGEVYTDGCLLIKIYPIDNDGCLKVQYDLQSEFDDWNTVIDETLPNKYAITAVLKDDIENWIEGYSK